MLWIGEYLPFVRKAIWLSVLVYWISSPWYLTSLRVPENFLSGAPLRSDIRRIPRPPERVKETAAGGTRRACP